MFIELTTTGKKKILVNANEIVMVYESGGSTILTMAHATTHKDNSIKLVVEESYVRIMKLLM